ncbi:MAG: hemin uptake protein HemP [Burkholderiales bacterium]|nr:hemin uptake protein HemP [Burkholderiales bacterium]
MLNPPPTTPDLREDVALASPALATPDTGLPRWPSHTLLGGGDEALIVHGDQVYRLRRTGTGKLILTK